MTCPPRAARAGGALAALLLAVLPAPSTGAGGAFVPPAPRDKCPVCGMFVARFPGWVAEEVLPDGSYLAFDGAKDLFRHMRAEEGAGKPRPAAVWVMDYYTLAPVDAGSAFFVTGSDVLGPMGRELVPFAREEDAREFLRDHRGEKVLRSGEITPALLRGLDGP